MDSLNSNLRVDPVPDSFHRTFAVSGVGPTPQHMQTERRPGVHSTALVSRSVQWQSLQKYTPGFHNRILSPEGGATNAGEPMVMPQCPKTPLPQKR